MLPVAEIVAVVSSLDDRFRCPLGDEAAQRWGAPVAGCVRSADGALVEHVGGYVVTAPAAVEGDPRDSDDLDDDTARAWGTLLADLPRTPPYVGLLHGDPEIDNVVWTAAGGTFVDLDDVHYGWYDGDVGYALRDWAQPAGAPDLTAPVPKAFLAGYRSRRTLTDEELTWLPALAQVSGAETLAGLEPLVAGPPDPGWPDWAIAIDRKVRDRADLLRAALRVDPGE